MTRLENINLHLGGQGRGVGKSCVPHPPLTLTIIRSMLETERACTLEITPILSFLEIDVARACYNATYTLCLKMHTKLKEEGLQSPLQPMPC